jgi:type IV pilus assembly protein PilV
MNTQPRHHRQQIGSSLIEVLVAILILAFGMLSLGGLLSFGVQLPKLSGYRATAAILAASYVERIRANPDGFANGFYQEDLSYDGTFTVPSLSDCTYPACTSTSAANTLATMDEAYMKRTLRQELPAGGMRVQQSTVGGGTSTTQGDLWIVWQEPSNPATLSPSGSDNCPSQVTGTYTSPRPRCLYIRFQL